MPPRGAPATPTAAVLLLQPHGTCASLRTARRLLQFQQVAMSVPPVLGPLENLRAAYQVLNDRVIRALHVQLGDPERLQEKRDQALQFLSAAEQVRTRRVLYLHPIDTKFT